MESCKQGNGASNDSNSQPVPRTFQPETARHGTAVTTRVSPGYRRVWTRWLITLCVAVFPVGVCPSLSCPASAPAAHTSS